MNQDNAAIREDRQERLSKIRDRLAENITRILTENLSAEEKETLDTEIRDELSELKKTRETLYKTLLATNATIDEFETLLRESESFQRKRRRLPITAPINAEIDIKEKQTRHFAQGLTFYKLFWVFFIGCFGGVIVETIWCIIKYGHYESRVGLIYGPFNLVYGIGSLALTLFLYNYRNRNKMNAFVGGFVVGSVTEYLCSWIQEMVFGSTSWDYSAFPFNINGRICLLYSIFWGFLGILWIKHLYPIMAEWILKIPNSVGKILTWLLLVFMICNTLATGVTVLRWTERINEMPPSNRIEEYIDLHYPNERMEHIFANLEFSEK